MIKDFGSYFFIMSVKLIELKRIIEKLGNKEQINILRLLKEHNVQTSENSKNTFADMREIPDECIEKISDFVRLCLQNIEVSKDRDRAYNVANEPQSSE